MDQIVVIESDLLLMLHIEFFSELLEALSGKKEAASEIQPTLKIINDLVLIQEHRPMLILPREMFLDEWQQIREIITLIVDHDEHPPELSQIIDGDLLPQPVDQL